MPSRQYKVIIMPSRQYQWQLRKLKEGRCIICGSKAETKYHCLKHAIASRERQRVRQQCKRRYNGSKTYVLEKQKGEQNG